MPSIVRDFPIQSDVRIENSVLACLGEALRKELCLSWGFMNRRTIRLPLLCVSTGLARPAETAEHVLLCFEWKAQELGGRPERTKSGHGREKK